MIVPALNAAEHIEEQLLALARQRTDIAWELIVVDNGSTDETRAIVDRYASELPVPVRVVEVPPGLSAARNAGAAAAVGELLLVADADDVVDDLWVEEMVGALRENPFVGGNLEVLELNGEEVAAWRPLVVDGGLPQFGGIPWVVGCNFGCTAAAFEAVGGFRESWDDMDFSLAMDSLGMTAVFAERAIVHYRYRTDPARAVGQMWAYGKQHGPRFKRYGVKPPTFLDVAVTCHRSAKQALRERLQGRRPVRPAVDVAFVLAEASVLWRRAAFWRPTISTVVVANPVSVQLDRLRRLRRRLATHGRSGA